MGENDSNSIKNWQLTVRDVYNNLLEGYKCELGYFWQRALFLGAFLLGIAAAYGIYVKDILLQVFLQKYAITALQKIVIISIIPLAICMLGICFSYLWIAMMKGSKAWYELYEDSIARFSNDAKNQQLENFWKHPSFKSVFNEESCPSEYRFGCMVYNMSKEEQKITKSNIFSTNRGDFSLSRINIAIGIISFITFFLCAAIHAGIGLCYVCEIESFCLRLLAIVIISVIIIFGIVGAQLLPQLIKSQNND